MINNKSNNILIPAEELEYAWDEFLKVMDLVEDPDGAIYSDDDVTNEREADWEAMKIELETNPCFMCMKQTDEPYYPSPCPKCAYRWLN